MIGELPQIKIYPSLVSRLETQYQSIQLILSTIDSGRVGLRRSPEKWNIHDTVAHLVAYQQMYTDRVIQALSEEEPFFCKYDASKDSDFEYWRTNEMEHLLNQLASDRQKLIRLIGKLDADQLKRIGMHKKYGSHNIIQWTEFFLLHEAHHIYNIFQLAYDIEMK
jgi:hypothetical protein